MRSPFPGMDPYLEHPTRWQSIHPQLISSLPGIIEPLLPERYAISVEERVYLMVTGDSLRLRRPDALVIDTTPASGARSRGGGVVMAARPDEIEVIVPDEEPVRELYLTVRDAEEDDEVVTVVEVL